MAEVKVRVRYVTDYIIYFEKLVFTLSGARSYLELTAILSLQLS
jgi:hypothetical protein